MSEYRYNKFTTGHALRDMRFSDKALKVGDSFPDFELQAVSGQTYKYSRNSGRPLLLITGSITCPMTASAMPNLKTLHRDFGNDVEFITLYTREAHPGENFPQPTTLGEKSEHAASLRREFEVPWTLVVDSMDGDLHLALDAKPNDAYLVDVDGKIVFRSLWSSDEKALRIALNSVVKGEKPRRTQSTAFIGPVMRAMSSVTATMRMAGPQASRDLLKSAPPMVMMAWVADLFSSGKHKADIHSA